MTRSTSSAWPWSTTASRTSTAPTWRWAASASCSATAASTTATSTSSRPTTTTGSGGASTSPPTCSTSAIPATTATAAPSGSPRPACTSTSDRAAPPTPSGKKWPDPCTPEWLYPPPRPAKRIGAAGRVRPAILWDPWPTPPSAQWEWNQKGARAHEHVHLGSDTLRRRRRSDGRLLHREARLGEDHGRADGRWHALGDRGAQGCEDHVHPVAGLPRPAEEGRRLQRRRPRGRRRLQDRRGAREARRGAHREATDRALGRLGDVPGLGRQHPRLAFASRGRPRQELNSPSRCRPKT